MSIPKDQIVANVTQLASDYMKNQDLSCRDAFAQKWDFIIQSLKCLEYPDPKVEDKPESVKKGK